MVTTIYIQVVAVEVTICILVNLQILILNDYEKIRYTTNPNEVATLLGVVYNLENDTEENKEAVRQIIENAHEKVSGLKWSDIADQFKVLIYKHSK